MGESRDAACGRRDGLASVSLWLGLFSLAFALPPTAILFIVPGFWLTGLNTTMVLSPVLAVVALATGIPARGGQKAAQACAGVWLGAVSLLLLASLAVRLAALLRSAA